MTLFDSENDPNAPPGPQPGAPESLDAITAPDSGAIPGPLSIPSPPPSRDSTLPADLRVSWSWPHFILFLFFSFSSFVVVQTVLAIHYAPHQRLTPQEYEKYLLNKPQFIIGSSLISFALIFLFLYITLAVLRDAPFWTSLGWKQLHRNSLTGKRVELRYFLSGFGLAVFVALAGSRMQPKDNAPIQEIFRNPKTAILVMAMAVLVAPLFEETVFRGYLYPLFAKSFGIAPGILITGILFGLLHGSQLGWSWGIVSLLILVGIVFTFVRARTGTVFSSFLLHLGYNSAIAVVTIASILMNHGSTDFHVPR